MKLAPIVLFVYNRPHHTQRTVESLQLNDHANESDLIIYADGAKSESVLEDIIKVRTYIRSITGFKSITIVESQENKGLANSIIQGVTEVVNKYNSIIVLEDDMLTSKYFLQYMNNALELYEKENDVISIHGYCYPVRHRLPETFLLKGADCWGWATWKRGWDIFEADATKLLDQIVARNLTKEFDFNNAYPYVEMLKNQIEGKVDSWAIRWYASAFLNNKLTLYPGKSLVKNIGLDGSGTHGEAGANYVVNEWKDYTKITLNKKKIENSKLGFLIIADFIKKNNSLAFKIIVGINKIKCFYSKKRNLKN